MALRFKSDVKHLIGGHGIILQDDDGCIRLNYWYTGG